MRMRSDEANLRWVKGCEDFDGGTGVVDGASIRGQSLEEAKEGGERVRKGEGKGRAKARMKDIEKAGQGNMGELKRIRSMLVKEGKLV